VLGHKEESEHLRLLQAVIPSAWGTAMRPGQLPGVAHARDLRSGCAVVLGMSFILRGHHTCNIAIKNANVILRCAVRRVDG